jgi:uncharacterized membrane protein (GlpM family)
VDIALKSCFAALVTAIILYSSRYGRSDIAAVATMIPVFTFLGAWFIASDQSPDHAGEFLWEVFLAIPVWIAFLLAGNLLLRVTDYRLALLGAIIAWLGAAFLYLQLR